MASPPTPRPALTESTPEEAKVQDKLEGSRPGVLSHLDLRPIRTSSSSQGSKTSTLLVLQDISSLELRIARDRIPVDEDDNCKVQECTTPKSKEYRLSEAKVCPPPPKKKNRTCKRKRVSPASEQYFVPPDLHALPDCIKALFK